jgi:hypothetical protein
MFICKGVLVNVYKSPDKETDDGLIEGKHKIQILGDIPLPGGGSRKDLVTLTAHNVEHYEGLEGTEVEVPIGCFAPAKNQVLYYIPKGA